MENKPKSYLTERTYRAILIFPLLCLMLLSCSSELSIGRERDEPCDSNRDCDDDERCIGSECISICENNDDCGSGEVCFSGTCQPEFRPEDGDDLPPDGDPIQEDGDLPQTDGDTDSESLRPDCRTASDCPLGHLCLEEKCEAGCRNQRDCPEGLLCDANAQPNGHCVECLTGGDCAPDWTCLNGYCRVPCNSDDDCQASPETPHCGENDVCLACLSDSQCSFGHICTPDGNCAEGCRGDRDCETPLVCDKDFGEFGGCFTCVDNNHCPGIKVCRSHNCVADCSQVECPPELPQCHQQTGECVQCTEKSHCQRGEVCSESSCIPGCEKDADCPGNQHCKPMGSGACVECVTDNHCPGDKICANDFCRAGGCDTDSDCEEDQYCHINLRNCFDYPGGSCAADEDCPLFSMGFQICDPLTHSCILSCFSEILCLPLDGSNRWQCIDGGCYECIKDSECEGVTCNLYNYMCQWCSGDDDCIDSSLHCQDSSGRCYECLEDAHCTGMLCHPEDFNCVECLADSDCSSPARPDCGKDNTCIPPCTDDCSSGDLVCDPDDFSSPRGYLACDDIDNDYCLEWSYSRQCAGHRTCSGDRCVCANECSTGDAQYCHATDPEQYWYCAEDSYGCLYWTTYSCGAGEICSVGECACGAECESGDVYCDPDYTNYVHYCNQSSTTGCWYWSSYVCNTGVECVDGSC